MTKKCSCNDCKCGKKSEEKTSENEEKSDEKSQKILRFKENTLNSQLFFEKTLKKVENNEKSEIFSEIVKKYKIVLIDQNITNGNTFQYSKELTDFEFAFILGEVFGIEPVDPSFAMPEDDEEEERFFGSLEDLLNFLKKRNDD